MFKTVLSIHPSGYPSGTRDRVCNMTRIITETNAYIQWKGTRAHYKTL